jgi:hypothetical protein
VLASADRLSNVTQEAEKAILKATHELEEAQQHETLAATKLQEATELVELAAKSHKAEMELKAKTGKGQGGSAGTSKKRTVKPKTAEEQKIWEQFEQTITAKVGDPNGQCVDLADELGKLVGGLRKMAAKQTVVIEEDEAPPCKRGRASSEGARTGPTVSMHPDKNRFHRDPLPAATGKYAGGKGGKTRGRTEEADREAGAPRDGFYIGGSDNDRSRSKSFGRAQEEEDDEEEGRGQFG